VHASVEEEIWGWGWRNVGCVRDAAIPRVQASVSDQDVAPHRFAMASRTWRKWQARDGRCFFGARVWAGEEEIERSRRLFGFGAPWPGDEEEEDESRLRAWLRNSRRTVVMGRP